MYNFRAIYDVNHNLKTILENVFEQVYIEQKKSVLEDKKREHQNDLFLFKIKQNKSSIFSKINSADTLKEIQSTFSTILFLTKVYGELVLA